MNLRTTIVSTNYGTTESTATESVKSDSAETGLNRNLVSPALTTTEPSKPDSAELKTSQNLPTTESITASGNVVNQILQNLK